MSLFSSPAFRVFNSENSESMIQRKPGSNVLQTRKPFVDRTVNCNTPDVQKKQKTNIPVKETANKTSPAAAAESLEIRPEDVFSYKDVDDLFEDLVPYSKCLEEQHVFTILKNYLNNDTPPSSPCAFGGPMEVYEMPVAGHSLNSSFNSNKSFDDMFLELPKYDDYDLGSQEVDVPVFDIDSL